MKELDRTKAYDLRSLNNNQINKLLNWLLENDKDWDHFNIDELKSGEFISFSKFYDQWLFDSLESEYINALTLFEPEVNIINQQSTDKVLPKMTEDKGQKHYDNSKGSLYQFCEDQKLNSYEFDIIKRVMRCRKKGNFVEDLEKTKFLIDLYLKEFNHEK